jgi:hypothetical protein
LAIDVGSRISLPALWHLRAPHNFPVSIANSRLAEVRLSFSNSESVGATFSSLRSLTRIEVPFICGIVCLPPHCDEILDSVSTHMPHTRTLQMEMFFITYTDPSLTVSFLLFCRNSVASSACANSRAGNFCLFRQIPGSLFGS